MRPETDAKIEGNNIVITINIDTLVNAAKFSQYFFDCKEDGMELNISDSLLFAKSVVNGLNNEEEDGSTLITRMFDEAIVWVSEQGEEGIEEV